MIPVLSEYDTRIILRGITPCGGRRPAHDASMTAALSAQKTRRNPDRGSRRRRSDGEKTIDSNDVPQQYSKYLCTKYLCSQSPKCTAGRMYCCIASSSLEPSVTGRSCFGPVVLVTSSSISSLEGLTGLANSAFSAVVALFESRGSPRVSMAHVGMQR